MTDQELLLNFTTRRDQPAFRQLVERHTPWLYSVCLRRLRDPALAEDATQAVFLALAQKAPTLLHEPTLSPWLHQVAKFVAANLLRARSRRQRHESEAAAMTPAMTPTAPATQWSDIEADLEPALDRLPTADRTLLLLRFYEQKSHPEIAALLNISEAAAAKRLERALARLRNHLAPPTPAGNASLTAAALASLLHAHTLVPLPATLAATTAATAAVSATTTTLAKGALLAMATAKLQTAAALFVAACILIAIPATVIVVHHNSAPITPTTPVAESAPADFLSYYALAPGESFKIVTNVPPDMRTAMLQSLMDRHSTAKFALPSDSAVMVFDWNRGQPQSPVIVAQTTMPLPAALKNLAALTLNLKLQDIDIKAPLPDSPYTVPGDVVYDSTLPPDQTLAALQAALEKQLHLRLKLSLQNTPTNTYILRGNWNYTPAAHPNLRMAPRLDGNKIDPLIEIYGLNDPNDSRITGNGVTTGAPGLAGQLAQWLDAPVLIEATDLPHFIGWRHFDAKSWPNDTPAAHNAAHDPTATLNHITEQTGLTWSQESRPTRHLSIEAAPQPDPFAQAYGLAPGQSLKRITDAPPEVRDPFVRERFHANPNRAAIFIDWSNNQMAGWSFYGSNRYTLTMLAQQLFFVSPEEVEGALARRTITGDFAYRHDFDAPHDQVLNQRCAALQTILRDELSIPASVQFRNVSKKIIVFHGKFHFTPLPNIPPATTPTGPGGAPVDCIELFSGEPFDTNSTISASGTGRQLMIARQISEFIHQEVFIEADNFPATFGFRAYSPRTADPLATPQDRDSILNHITQQTALTWTEETRTVRHLFIEPAQ